MFLRRNTCLNNLLDLLRCPLQSIGAHIKILTIGVRNSSNTYDWSLLQLLLDDRSPRDPSLPRVRLDKLSLNNLCIRHPVTTGGGMTYLPAGFNEIRSVALQDACDQGIYPDDISDSSVPTALRDSPTLAPSLRVHKLTLKVPYQWHLWTWVRYDLRRSIALDRLQVLRVVDCDERHLQRVVTDFGKCATSIKVTQQDFDDGVPLDLSSHTGLKNLQLALSTTSTACYYNTEKLDLIVDALNTLSPHQLTSLKIETNLHISESYCDDDLPGDLFKGEIRSNTIFVPF
ncbi:hypothetical protein EUX98_g9010 [Antrodiella citrinella]|uniref:Uncharacterized protein n=1 Tax=Antrodiella citrinella TaxID=2447956 RepID=A0A4S4LZG2_9APHY|nr:hypothetical protein EUX98_g9010 [Antrodiella citrinella]